jgi:hypothetical protein
LLKVAGVQKRSFCQFEDNRQPFCAADTGSVACPPGA